MKKINTITIKILLFVVFMINMIGTSVLASTDYENRSFKRITIDDGLSQMSIESLFQDSYGYMWIGTRDGLNRYNGHSFEVYKYKEASNNSKNNNKSISGNSITDIAEDGNGNIWIGTSAGLNKIDRKTNEITQYLPNKNGCNISNYRIREILIGLDGNILVATDDGLNKYDSDTDNFIRIYNSRDESKSLSSQKVYSVVEDNKGYYWVGTCNGLNRIDKITNDITKYYKNEEDDNSISGNYITKVYVDDSNSLWVGTYYQFLSKIDLNTGVVTRYDAGNTNIQGGYIKDILRDSRGSLWIATEGGLNKLDEKNKKFNTYRAKSYDSTSLANNDILSICEDKSGTIWVGTLEGISLFNPDNEFNHYKNNPLDANSLSENKISGIYEDNEGILWVGTIYDGLNIFDRENNKVTRIDHHKSDGEIVISNNLVREITGIDNEVWIATENGLDKYDKNTDIITRYDVSNGLTNIDVRTLFIDSEGILWIGTRDGLFTFDRKDTFKNYTEILKKSGITETKFTDIHEDKDGTMWFASGVNSGLIRYDKSTNIAKSYNNMSSTNDKSYDVLLAINSDSKGNIWVGTDKGLIKFNKESEKFIRYTEENALANNFIYGVLLDENEDVWVSTNYGISKLDVKNEKIISFDSTDGLQGNEFNEYSYYKSSSGEMFFGGINGLTSFIPKDIPKKEYIPSIKIEDIDTNIGNIEVEDNIELNYKNNQVEFKFFITYYLNPHKIEYAYKLSGVDEKWIHAENRNYAKYTNLKPGKYVFKVIGKSSAGEWSDPTAISIIIKNPPWKTPVAYAIYIFIVLTSIFVIWNRVKILNALVRQRTNELNKRLKENRELYAQLLKHEKYKNNYFVNLSHELRTPLNIIVTTQNLIESLNNKKEHIPKEKIGNYIDTMKRNSNRLISLIDNIIYTSKIESGAYDLNIEEIDIVYLVEEATLSMKEFIDNKKINLIIEPYVEEKIIQCDKLKIEKAIINIISNAIKFTEENGKIEVYIWDLDGNIGISIRDTGIGIDAKNYESIFNRLAQDYETTSEEYGGNGLGLTLTRQLIEIHGGEIWVESIVGEGSEFIIILPVNQN